MKLYYSPGACSLASRIVAEEIGLALDYEKVDLQTHKTEGGKDYYAIAPKGAVPAVRLDDGSLLTENVAILQYLGDSKPNEGLVPKCGTMERVRLQEWLGFLASEVHKAFVPLFHGDDAAAKTAARAELGTLFGLIEDKLPPEGYLMGERFGVADAYLFVLLSWTHKTGVDVKRFDKLIAFRERVAHRDGVKRALKRDGVG